MNRIALTFTDKNPERARLHRDVVARVNDLAGNERETVLPATKNTEFAVRHGLGRVPTEYHVLMQDVAGQLIRSSPEKWTDEVAYFTFTGDGGPTARLRIRVR